jgi:hypothetical protein
MDDMALGNPVSPVAQLLALFEPRFPGIPYSAVPPSSNWELWLNFLMQRSIRNEVKDLR